MSWPIQVTDGQVVVEQSQAAQELAAKSEPVSSLSPSLVLADDCRAPNGTLIDNTIVTGAKFLPQTQFFAGVYVDGSLIKTSVTRLKCHLVSQTTARCDELLQLLCPPFATQRTIGTESVFLQIRTVEGSFPEASVADSFP